MAIQIQILWYNRWKPGVICHRGWPPPFPQSHVACTPSPVEKHDQHNLKIQSQIQQYTNTQKQSHKVCFLGSRILPPVLQT